MTHFSSEGWEIFQQAAARLGLNLPVVVSRSTVQPTLDGYSQAGLLLPERYHSTYRTILLLGAGGRGFWEQFQAAPEAHDGLPDPLDRFSVRQVDSLAAIVRSWDPTAVSAFPFRHPQQVIPFQALVSHTGLTRPAPFGVAIHPIYGPWFAWRGLILCELEWPETSGLETSPCHRCSAPCLQACPAAAARPEGLIWERCLQERRRESPCRGTCASRTACIVGTEHQYGSHQTAYHAAASLREIMAME